MKSQEIVVCLITGNPFYGGCCTTMIAKDSNPLHAEPKTEETVQIVFELKSKPN